MRLLGNILVVDPLPLLSDCPSPRVDLSVLSGAARPPLTISTRLGLFVVARTFVDRWPPKVAPADRASPEYGAREDRLRGVGSVSV